MKKLNLTYQKSGVNINAADKFVNFISNISSKNKGKKKFDTRKCAKASWREP